MPRVAGTAVTLADGATLRSAEFAIVDELRLWGGERLLFVECGDGWAAEEAWRRMGKGCVCGVDRSSTLVARAARLRDVPGKLEFQTWDGRHLLHPDGWFDSVVFQADVGRWPQPASVLREMRRVARSEGEIYLVEVGASDGGSRTPDWASLLDQAGLALKGVRLPADAPGTRILCCVRGTGGPT
jgi:ubiquinone/menaquinone biosynthesis C-methylase UbiE